MVNMGIMKALFVAIADAAVKRSLKSLSTLYNLFECVCFTREHPIHRGADNSASR